MQLHVKHDVKASRRYKLIDVTKTYSTADNAMSTPMN